MSESDNCGLLYFNPRSPQRGRLNSAMSNNGTAISIHALAKERHEFISYFPVLLIISIHAPAKGLTDLLHIHNFQVFYFNPRSRKGSDELPAEITIIDICSNPRSRKGATPSSLNIIHSDCDFNPRFRKGSDVPISSRYLIA
ncbi:MAG: hypothetical protein ACLS61_15850 [Ruminococcus sp.]